MSDNSGGDGIELPNTNAGDTYHLSEQISEGRHQAPPTMMLMPLHLCLARPWSRTASESSARSVPTEGPDVLLGPPFPPG